MSATSSTEKNSGGDSTTSTGTSTPASEVSGTVREFLYLDFPKLSSYFAQLNRGLTIEIKSTSGREHTETQTSPTHDVGIGGEASGTVGGGSRSTPEALLARLIGVEMGMRANLSAALHSGSSEESLASDRREVATIQLHHAAFEMVAKELWNAGLVVTDPSVAAGRFLAFTGIADLVDFDHLAESIKNFSNFGSLFQKVTGQADFSKGVNRPKETGQLIEHFYKGRVGVHASLAGKSVSAYLSPDYLTAPIGFILENYGRYTQVPLTVFGLKVGWSYPWRERSGEGTFVDGLVADSQAEAGMMQNMLNMNRSLEAIDRFFRVRADAHVYPLAVYVDLPISSAMDKDPVDSVGSAPDADNGNPNDRAAV